jgi:hypothetical protein
MTAVAATSSLSRAALARPNASERFLLRLSRAIESAALARMQRRASSAGSHPPRADADADSRTREDAAERRRDAAAVTHIGLMPR